jgi:hypothetical protein
VPPGRRAALGALAVLAAALSCRGPATSTACVLATDILVFALFAREPAIRDGHRRHGVVRARRLLRPRAYAAALRRQARASHGGSRSRWLRSPRWRARSSSAGSASGCPASTLAMLTLRIRADRLVGRFPVGRGHRRLERDRRRVASTVAREQGPRITGSRWR